MPSDFVSILINSSGAVATCAMFLWYKSKEDKRNQRREEVRDTNFIKAMTTNTKVIESVGKKIEVVDKKVDEIRKDHKEDKEIIKKMYDHAVEAYGTKRNVQVSVTQ